MQPDRQRYRRALGLLAAALAGNAVVMTGGCQAGYTSYPPMQGSQASTDPTAYPMPNVMRASLRWALRRNNVEGRVAIALPEGLGATWQENFIARLNVQNASPVRTDTLDLPRLHVVRVWIRADEATVELYRPVALTNETWTHQSLTLHLRSGLGFGPWRVTGSKVGLLGIAPEPAPRPIDQLQQEPDQSRLYDPDDA